VYFKIILITGLNDIWAKIMKSDRCDSTETYSDIIKMNHASPRSSQSKLVFFLAYTQSRCISFNNETGNSFVALETVNQKLMSEFITDRR
jgi:hypothetical protein